VLSHFAKASSVVDFLLILLSNYLKFQFLKFILAMVILDILRERFWTQLLFFIRVYIFYFFLLNLYFFFLSFVLFLKIL